MNFGRLFVEVLAYTQVAKLYQNYLQNVEIVTSDNDYKITLNFSDRIHFFYVVTEILVKFKGNFTNVPLIIMMW